VADVNQRFKKSNVVKVNRKTSQTPRAFGHTDSDSFPVRKVLGVVMACVSFSAHAETFTGTWITEDGASIVSIEVCSDAVDQFCGYLVQFPSTGNTALDRALCEFRMLGGLSSGVDGLVDGWIFDPESGSAYNLIIRGGKPAGAINLLVYGRTKVLGETVVWTRAVMSYPGSGEQRNSMPCAF